MTDDIRTYETGAFDLITFDRSPDRRAVSIGTSNGVERGHAMLDIEELPAFLEWLTVRVRSVPPP